MTYWDVCSLINDICVAHDVDFRVVNHAREHGAHPLVIKRRKVFREAHAAGLTCAEIAEVAGMSRAAVTEACEH